MAALPRTASLVVASLLGILMLCTLGVWQLERLQWKTALIAERRAELQAPPVPLSVVLSAIKAGKPVENRPVTLSGRFLPGRDLRLFSTAYGPGWEIVSPFLLSDGSMVLVDRGFLPEVSGKETVSPAPPTTPLSISGYAGQPPAGKSVFAPRNDRQRNRWFWWDLPAMAAAAGGREVGPLVPIVVQLSGAPLGGSDAPRPITPVIALPNNHLAYALTWFALALALAVMTILALRESRRSARA